MASAVATSGIALPLLATVIGTGGVCLGLWLDAAGRRSRVVVPFSAGLLIGVVLFGLLPELIAASGWPKTALLFGAGYVLLLAINRYVAPVCPSCSLDHDHFACQTTLHGFAVPLVSASALHSLMDGWSIAAAQMAGPVGIRVAVPIAIALHKIPEGIALGAILRASLKARSAALGWGVVAEGVTLLGGVLAVSIAPSLGNTWITYPLGTAAGWLCYLGAHAVHEEWKHRGPVPAVVTALAGAVVAAALQQGVQNWLR